MAYKIKKEKEKKNLDELKESFEVPKEQKKDKKQLFLEDVKNKDTITESEVLLLKRRLNDGTYTSKDVYEALGEDGKQLTPEQTEKGKSWLMNKWKSPSGVERKNNPFGYREQEILEKFEGIKIKDFYDVGNYGNHYYEPYYEVEGNNTSFEYYNKAGEPTILG